MSPAPGDYEVALVCRGAGLWTPLEPASARRLPPLRCRYANPGSKPPCLSATAEFVLTSGGPRGGNNHTAQIAEPAARVAAVSRRLAEPLGQCRVEPPREVMSGT